MRVGLNSDPSDIGENAASSMTFPISPPFANKTLKSFSAAVAVNSQANGGEQIGQAGKCQTRLTLSMKESFVGAILALADATGSGMENCLGAISALADFSWSKMENCLGAVSTLADATWMEFTSSVFITELGNISLADTSVTGITPGFLSGITSNGITPSSLGFPSILVIMFPTLLCTPPTETVDNE